MIYLGTSYSNALHYVRFTRYAARLAAESKGMWDSDSHTGRYDNKKHRRSFKVRRSRIKYFNKEV